VLYDKALKAGRLKGLRHDGVWIEVGTPDAVDIASDVFAKL
jgi:MurNAc alpha-1-phosphate uridylyltransferase